MIDHLDTPAAWARLSWTPSSAGGRRAGPPTAPVDASTCAFPLGGESELIPGWPASREDFSVLIEMLDVVDEDEWFCALDFLARDLVADLVCPGGTIVMFEGRKVVATGKITKIDSRVLSSPR